MTSRQWEIYVRKARQYYTRYDSHRFKVATIAIEACDLTHGGRKDQRFTIKSFASAIGLNRKTLYEWIRIKTNVIDKLPVKMNPEKISFTIITRVSHRVKSDMTTNDIKRIYSEEAGIDPRLFTWNRYIKHMKSVAYNAVNPMHLMDIPDDSIAEVLSLAKTIVENLNREIEYRKQGTTGAKIKAASAIGKFNGGIRAARKSLST